jgi:hypothetical protein
MSLRISLSHSPFSVPAIKHIPQASIASLSKSGSSDTLPFTYALSLFAYCLVIIAYLGIYNGSQDLFHQGRQQDRFATS